MKQKDKPSVKVGERQPKANLRVLKNYYANYLKDKQKRQLI